MATACLFVGWNRPHVGHEKEAYQFLMGQGREMLDKWQKEGWFESDRPYGLTAHGGDRRRVLAVQGGAQGNLRFFAQVQGAAKSGDQGRQVDIDGKVCDAGIAQRLDRQQDNLGIGGRLLGADDLDTGLHELAFRAKLAAPDPQHVSGIGEA